MQASLAQHPARPLENGHRTDSSSSYSPNMSAKSLIASTFHVLEQAPPPSLREILGAYRASGDGDRDMLLAMLSAKSAEDQRIAAVAALHRSMLEHYYPSVPSPVPASPPPPPPPHHHHQYHHVPHHQLSHSRTHPHPYAVYPPPDSRARPYSSPDSPGSTDRDQPRKRHRRSRSPASGSPHSSPHSVASAVPSSPYSEASRSPAARGAMAIDSLLHGGRRADDHDRERERDLHTYTLPPLASAVAAN